MVSRTYIAVKRISNELKLWYLHTRNSHLVWDIVMSKQYNFQEEDGPLRKVKTLSSI